MSPKPIPRSEKLVLVLMFLQVAIPLAVNLLRPGFDKKNSLGLDYDFWIAMAVLSGVLWFVGLAFAFQLEGRRIRYVLGHIVTLFFGTLYLVLIA
jgi:hypothetical protein